MIVYLINIDKYHQYASVHFPNHRDCHSLENALTPRNLCALAAQHGSSLPSLPEDLTAGESWEF